MTFPLRGADGQFRDFLTLAIPVRDAFGRIVRWVGTNTDVEAQRRAEEALRRSEKIAAVGRLASSIAHEINNPLEAVTNLNYLAKSQTTDEEVIRVSAETVEKHGESLGVRSSTRERGVARCSPCIFRMT